MPRYVQDGSLDCGLTGHDWILENDAKVVELAELVFSKVSRRPVRWVLAVPNDSPIKSVKDLQGKRIATEVVSLTRRWLAQHGVDGQGRVQLGRHRGEAAAAGRRHRRGDRDRQLAAANNLRIVAELLQSTTRFIANEKAYADPWKKQKMDDLVLMLQGAMAAEGKVGLMMNVRKADLTGGAQDPAGPAEPDHLLAVRPEWVAVNTIIDENTVRHIMPQLKQAGARDRRVSAEQDHRLSSRANRTRSHVCCYQ